MPASSGVAVLSYATLLRARLPAPLFVGKRGLPSVKQSELLLSGKLQNGNIIEYIAVR